MFFFCLCVVLSLITWPEHINHVALAHSPYVAGIMITWSRHIDHVTPARWSRGQDTLITWPWCSDHVVLSHWSRDPGALITWSRHTDHVTLACWSRGASALQQQEVTGVTHALRLGKWRQLHLTVRALVTENPSTVPAVVLQNTYSSLNYYSCCILLYHSLSIQSIPIFS